MAQVVADREAIQEFRQALLTLAARLQEVLAAVDAGIARSETSLSLAEARSRQRVYQLRNELDYCLSAAAYGYPVDCSSLYYALDQAEEYLNWVLALKRRFNDALRWYDSTRNRLEKLLTHQLSQSIAFLDRRISALEAYHATQLLETATAIAGSGIWQLMGAVPALLRRSQAGLNKALGDVGEEIAAVILSRRYGLQELPFTQPTHGFDRVFAAPGLPVIVVESKTSSRGKLRLRQTNKGQQASPGWIADKSVRMADPNSTQWSPVNERIGRLIQEMGAQNVPSLAVVTDPARRVADVYARDAAGGWTLLEGEIRVDDYADEEG